MRNEDGPRPRSRVWTEQLPLALGGLLVVAGVALVVAVLLAPSAPDGGPTGFESLPPSFSLAPIGSQALPSPTPTPPAFPSATPQPTPREIAETAVDLTWQSVAVLPGTASDPVSQTVLVAGVAHGPDGYIAVGQVVDGFLTETGATGPIQPAIWTSRTGKSWQLADAGALGEAMPNGVAATSTDELILASTASGTILLHAAHGGDWTAATPPDARILRIAAAGPGFIAIGERISNHHQAIWSSTDGSTWTRTWESNVDLGEFLNTISGRSDGHVVVGGTQLPTDASSIRATALVSPDGLHWTRVDPAHLPSTMGFDAVGIGADGAWYGAGFDRAHGGIGIWRSTDGATWTPTSFGPAQRTELPGDTGSVSAVFAFNGRTIVLAYTSCCGDPPQRALVSRDGNSWARIDRSSVIRAVRVSDLVVETDRVVAVGSVNRAAGVWIGTAAPTGGVEFATELAPPSSLDVCGSGVTLQVKVEVDRSGSVARIHLVRTGDSGSEVSGVVWPYGWRASAGPPLTISNATGTVMVREGDEITLSDGLATGGSYHICQLNGTPVFGG